MTSDTEIFGAFRQTVQDCRSVVLRPSGAGPEPDPKTEKSGSDFTMEEFSGQRSPIRLLKPIC